MRRFTRLTNAFSKKLENHVAAVALHSMFYNFVRVHQTLKVSSAMAAGVTIGFGKSLTSSKCSKPSTAKEKRVGQPVFEVRKWKIGTGYFVRVTFQRKTD